MSKGSRLSRIIDYFKEGELKEVRYIYSRAGDILNERQRPVTKQLKLPVSGTQKRKRRTKAELAAARATAAGVTNSAPVESMPMKEQEANAAAAAGE